MLRPYKEEDVNSRWRLIAIGISFS